MPKLNKNEKKGTEKHSAEGKNESSKIQKPVKKPKKHNIDNIGKSKQLSAKLKNMKPRSPRSNPKNTEPRVCGNGKPMPSLAELEKMFDDSDDENVISGSTTISQRCKTPETTSNDEKPVILSPSAIKDLSNKMMEIISKLPDSSVLVNDKRPSLPVVPPKKRKKPEVPYIVGCKDRPKVIKKSNVVIGKGDGDYGVDYSNLYQSDDEDQCPSTRKKRSDLPSISKSIFNPKSEEIAAMLREYDSADVQSDGSVDSNKTVSYDCTTLSPNFRSRSFSPLPSTSKDNETFLKNDLRFNESLLENSLNNDSSNSGNEVEIIEMPCETVIIDDEGLKSNKYVKTSNNDVEIVPHKSPPPPSFDVCEDDMYSSIVIDIDQTYGNSDCEIIDVDDVIAENKTIIDKYRKNTEMNAVTHVKPCTSNPPTVENVAKGRSPVKENMKRSSESVNQCKRQNSIEDIVHHFFNEQTNTNEAGPSSLSSEIETVNLSSSTSECVLKDILGSIISFAQSLSNTFIRDKSHLTRNNNEIVTDSIVLDQSTRHDESVVFVSSSLPQLSVNSPTSNLQNDPNDDSVILVNSAGDLNTNISSTYTNLTKKKRKSKTTKSQNNPTPQNEKSPIRNIGDCPICMENMSSNTLASTICGHIFCMPCIQTAIKAGGKKCPTCRKVLRGVGYHQLFL